MLVVPLTRHLPLEVGQTSPLMAVGVVPVGRRPRPRSSWSGDAEPGGSGSHHDLWDRCAGRPCENAGRRGRGRRARHVGDAR